MRSAVILAALPLVLAAPSKRASPAPLLKPRNADVIEGKYIVKMRSSSSVQVLEAHKNMVSSNIEYTYNSHKFTGFAAAMTAEEVEALQNMPDVEYIEHDAIVKAYATQEGADWGLARLSNTSPGSSTYTYDDSAGEGVCAYVVDTGIDVTHPEFEGRATFASNQVDDDDTDGNGHGTHVAGTIGSKTFGVAKKVALYAVKVLGADGSGTNAGVIAGMDFVVSDAPSRDCPKGVVVNLSLGGSVSSSINDAAANVVSAGHFMAVAAGNEAADASTSSPASEPSVCTVGATDKTDALSYFSNFGSLVDILAPGSDIESTWPGGKTNTISGTSMASPHVAGIGAYFLGLGAASPSGLCEYIASQAQGGAISGVPSGTTDAIIQNGEA
ncbi:putative serine protease precursor [Rosellinia necatrix]|uniref:Putative serine protease n=1 Tax=Rosellinia necatrix TaxID=77044 RepID=A0A1W2TMQ2_ROSNE|nr:putative serine protease precursor [Rosellinia necatrix]